MARIQQENGVEEPEGIVGNDLAYAEDDKEGFQVDSGSKRCYYFDLLVYFVTGEIVLVGGRCCDLQNNKLSIFYQFYHERLIVQSNYTH